MSLRNYMDNSNFGGLSLVEDFIWNSEFRNWVLHPDAESDIFWSEWITTYPEKKPEVLMARQIIKAITIKNIGISDQEIKLAITEILKEVVQNEATLKEKTKKYEFRKRSSFFLIAASLLLTVCIAFFFRQRYADDTVVIYNDLVRGANEKLIEKVNNGEGLLHIRLEDGSRITLQKNAKISFPQSFKGLVNRKVYLTGEAFFDIAKDPGKPFFVYANGLITKVLGTSFKITSNVGEKDATVEVTSGIVAVFSLVDKQAQDVSNTNMLNSIILTRNQKASYSSRDRTLITSLVNHPIALNETAFDSTFSNTPIESIFENIEEEYGIKIIYDEKSFHNRTFTGDLSKITMYEKLEVICKTVNSKYEVLDGRIVIYN